MMDSILYVLVAILGLSTLIVIHEFGHFIVARAFGMRARVFSVGFGPTVAQWRPKGGETVYQIAAIPVLAYVNIAGMDPREPSDPHDRGSYKNGSLLARLFVIAGGPLANYLAAMAIAFVLFAAGGVAAVVPRGLEVVERTAAAQAGIRSGDRIVRVDGVEIRNFDHFATTIAQSNGRTLHFVLQRGNERVERDVTPRLDPTSHRYRVGVTPFVAYAPITLRGAAMRAMEVPAHMAVESVKGLKKMFVGGQSVRVMGPVGIVNEMVHEARRGWRDWLWMLCGLSVGLFFLNLLPIPALDGGRAVFLGYEMLLRRKLPPRFEYAAVAVSMVLLLGVAAVVMVFDVRNWH